MILLENRRDCNDQNEQVNLINVRVQLKFVRVARIPVVNKQPPSRSSRPAVVKPADFIPPTGKDRFYPSYSPRHKMLYR
jgi:hypothetical protein